jgi:hypothetical protein
MISLDIFLSYPIYPVKSKRYMYREALKHAAVKRIRTYGDAKTFKRSDAK